ncbi:uncharacterized protein MONBRDRAFT_628, partial [Monosiga brevicollis MX1]
MKNRFSTLDLQVQLAELKPRLTGMRVANIYDIDNKTYLIRLQQTPEKAVLLIESGIRFHTTEYDWPKGDAPSGFTMKCRKHLRTRRLTDMKQLGVDRVIDLTFGSDEAAYHLIIELYDRGNIILTESTYNILALLRRRTDSEDVKFAVGERYPIEASKQPSPITRERLEAAFASSKKGDPARKALNPIMECGPQAIEHCMQLHGFPNNAKVGKGLAIPDDLDRVLAAMKQAEDLLFEKLKAGDISVSATVVQYLPIDTIRLAEGDEAPVLVLDDVIPFMMKQFEDRPHIHLPSFDRAIDRYFSELETQKLQMRAMQQEAAALKKLEAVKASHEKHVEGYRLAQEANERKAQVLEANLEQVDRAIEIIRSMVANKLDWVEIAELVKEAQQQGDPDARIIDGLKLDKNHMTIRLPNPEAHAESSESDSSSASDSEEEEEEEEQKAIAAASKKRGTSSATDPFLTIDLDLALTAYANACNMYQHKKISAVKEQKARDATELAIQSAERKTQQQLQQNNVTTAVNKQRKIYWFEKFLWFISSENYLVIGGRDRQQNEILVRRYLKKGDVYVHADLHGAASVIVKNPRGGDVPPITLQEAGHMAVIYSGSWEARMPTSAWWVHHDQVSKTAPAGEYLSTGSFMIRGKKNYLPKVELVMGFAILFKVDEGSVARHVNERRPRGLGEASEASSPAVSRPPEPVEASSSGAGDASPVAAESEAGDSTATQNKNKAESQPAGTAVVAPEVPAESSSAMSTAAAMAFPDTEISVDYASATPSASVSRTVSHAQSEADTAVRSRMQGSKARLSAKQKRQLKKKGYTPAQMSSLTAAELQELTGESGEDSEGEDDQRNEHAQQPAVRGKRGKKKKKQQKYAEQDEDERQLRLDLLGSAGPQLSRADKRARRKEKLAAKQQATRDPSEAVLQQISSVTDRIMATAESVGLVTTEQTSKQEKIDEQIQAQEEDQLTYLDALTGLPHPDDELMFALPVVAPYGAVRQYRFKAKIVPGEQKKGKAIRSLIHHFCTETGASSAEVDVIKAIKDLELFRSVPGKIKVMA